MGIQKVDWEKEVGILLNTVQFVDQDLNMIDITANLRLFIWPKLRYIAIYPDKIQ
jgi:hypothetical protein